VAYRIRQRRRASHARSAPDGASRGQLPTGGRESYARGVPGRSKADLCSRPGHDEPRTHCEARCAGASTSSLSGTGEGADSMRFRT
jgi:hypothetical protein